MGKVCLASWPRAQGWPCAGYGLWNQRWIRVAVFRHWPLAVRQAIFRAAGRVSVLALGRVSARVRQCGGIGLWPCFSPDKRALAKNKAPNFRSLHEAKELVLFPRCGHELLTFRGYDPCRNSPQPFSTFSVRKNNQFLFKPMHPPRHGP